MSRLSCFWPVNRRNGGRLMLESAGQVTTSDGVRLSYRKLGEGSQPVILPNGHSLLEDWRRIGGGRTIVVYDLRNRGESDAVADRAKLERGIHNDVDDLE